MLGKATRKHYHVVEICEADSGDESSQHDGHETLIRRRGITKPEWHFHHFKESDVGDEWFSRRRIVRRELDRRPLPSRAMRRPWSRRRRQCLIEPRQREAIEFRRFVDATIIDAHVPGSVFLLNHNDWRRQWGCRRARDVRVHQFLDFTFDGDSLVSVVNTTRGLPQRTRVDGVNFMEYNVSSTDVGIAFSEDVELVFNESAQF